MSVNKNISSGVAVRVVYLLKRKLLVDKPIVSTPLH